MTNNEIIQTLKDAIDLISRQQAEIDVLKATLKGYVQKEMHAYAQVILSNLKQSKSLRRGWYIHFA